MNNAESSGQPESDLPPWAANSAPSKSGNSKWLWAVIVVLAVAVAVLVVALVIRPGADDPVAASSPSSEPAPEPAVSAAPESEPTDTATESATAEAAEATADGAIGEPVENSGTKLTVDSVSTQDSIPMDDPELASPPEGGEFFVVEATVENTGQSSQDLTCSLPIVIHAIDDQGRQFDTVESLYRYEGNPECNAQLQPGFSATMTWPFVVPEGATIDHIAFQDYDNEDYEDFSLISVVSR